MASDVSWVINATINEGKLDDLKAIAGSLCDAVKADEPGALNYEWYFSADGKFLSIYERYADSDAVLTHMKNLGPRMGEFMACISPDPGTFVIYGDPSDKVLGAFGDWRPVVVTRQAGFSR